MKKVTVLCLDTDRDRALDRLQAAGVLHVTPVTPPAGESLDNRRRDLDSARKALALLDAEPVSADAAAPAWPDAAALADEIIALADRHRELTEKKASLRRERATAALFGDFDPAALRQLADAGVRVAFFRARGKGFTPPSGKAWTRLGSDRYGTIYAVADATTTPHGSVEVAPPERPLGSVDRELREAEAAAAEAGRRLAGLSTARAALAAHARRLEDDVAFLEARTGMGTAGRIAYLGGFCPARRIEALEAAAERHGWGLLVEEPGAADAVPTLIENPRWLRPVETVFSAIRILPGYREVDVSAPFLFFLSLFFAMIVGDAGYGLVFLALTALGRRKFRDAPPGPFILMTIFSLCTIVWGVLNGAYFGIDPLPAPVAALQARIPVTRWLADRNNIMTLCLVIGSVHLSIAHAWNAIRLINRLQALSQVGWIGVIWSIYFLAQRLMFGHPFPPGWAAGAVTSVALVVLFMTPPSKFRSEWINHAMLPLSLMSGFGDVLSYLRLYALGVAGFKVAGAFNLMVGNLGFSNALIAPVSAVILCAAHALNIALSAMSVLVHGIRLNTLEFSMHLGLEWSGVKYRPFRMDAEAVAE